MSDSLVLAWILFVLAGMFTGFMAGYFIGHDKAMEKIEYDPRRYEWYRWPKLKVGLDDYQNDYALARQVNQWLKDNVHQDNFKLQVMDDETQIVPPLAYFFIKDQNIALTLSIKHNILYIPGYGQGYQR